MAKRGGIREWIEKIFPSDDGGRQKTNELVERGLEALRQARDARAFSMGDIRRVPSRLELRIAPERYEELVAMDAVRDLGFFFNDELMKDLAAENMRTFGDHAVRVTVAADTALGPDEIYAEVLAPEASAPEKERGQPHGRSQGARSQDATRVLGSDEGPSTVAIVPEQKPVEQWRLKLAGPGGLAIEERLEGRYWIFGRRGNSGRPLPAQHRKLDLPLRETVSREQLRVELFEDHARVESIGKGIVMVSIGEQLHEGESRSVPLGSPFFIDEYELVLTR